jgi:hypothetical protein
MIDRTDDYNRQTIIDGDRADEAADFATTRHELLIEAQSDAYWDGLSDAEEGKPHRNPYKTAELWTAYETGYREGQEDDK